MRLKKILLLQDVNGKLIEPAKNKPSVDEAIKEEKIDEEKFEKERIFFDLDEKKESENGNNIFDLDLNEAFNN